jgi:predicted RNA-binding Zn-ribbon protein involved in translation (DUF1610 family)
MVLYCISCEQEFEVDDYDMGDNVFDCPNCGYSFEKYIDNDDLREWEL